MIVSLIQQGGPWTWLIFGLVLIGLEVLVPGNFIIWLGFASVLTGFLSLALWDWAGWVWQIQWLVFGALSVASVFVGRKVLRKRIIINQEPLLNQRAHSLVGRTADLIDPIVNGFGRVKLGDTVWIVKGPELPTGTRIKVVSWVGSELVVEPL